MLAGQDRDGDGGTLKPKPQLLPLHVSSPPPQQEERLEEAMQEEKEGGQIKMEVASYSCQAVAYPLPPPLTEAEPNPEVIKDPEGCPSCTAADSDSQELPQICLSREESASSVCQQKQSDTLNNLLLPSQKELSETPASAPPTSNLPLSLIVGPEDPMAGMFALLTASELARARPSTPPIPILTPQMENPPAGPECSGALEMVALEGMALLSQMAQEEMEHISMDEGEQLEEETKKLILNF